MVFSVVPITTLINIGSYLVWNFLSISIHYTLVFEMQVQKFSSFGQMQYF